jgi:2-polyprenyl-3-methyl-5-hydroxy-6-metoxy-1,4-benzoquinol methylase
VPNGPFPLLKTFRDPSGHVDVQAQTVLRHVRPHAREQALAILQSDFYRRGVERGDLVASAIKEDDADSELILEHPRVFFPTYCWEWSPSQWMVAAELTLRLCEEALTEGWILKDATPLNVLFEGPKPIFVDVLSFEPRNPQSSIWIAQAQFLRSFLLPLLAHRRLAWPMTAFQARRDGISPEDLLPALSQFDRCRPAIFWNVTLPALIDRRTVVSEEQVQSAKLRQSDPEIATALLSRGLRKLKKQIADAVRQPAKTHWSEYQGKLGHYSDEDQAKKRSFVEEFLAACRPSSVLDIGANTGTYSALAARAGARVVSIDLDEASIGRLHHKAHSEKLDIQPLVMNLARPTPALGWAYGEQISFLDRAAGRFDAVFMLAVIHHLLLTDQIPLDHIAETVSHFTNHWLIIEWVPESDVMYRQILRGRGELYAHLNEMAMVEAFSRFFRVERTLKLGNGRTLYWLQKAA